MSIQRGRKKLKNLYLYETDIERIKENANKNQRTIGEYIHLLLNSQDKQEDKNEKEKLESSVRINTEYLNHLSDIRYTNGDEFYGTRNNRSDFYEEAKENVREIRTNERVNKDKMMY